MTAERKNNCYVQKHWPQIQKILFIYVTAGFYNQIERCLLHVSDYACLFDYFSNLITPDIGKLFGFLLPCKCFIFSQLDFVVPHRTTWSFLGDQSHLGGSAHLPTCCQSPHLLAVFYWQRSFSDLELKAQENTWSTGAKGVPISHLNITEGKSVFDSGGSLLDWWWRRTFPIRITRSSGWPQVHPTHPDHQL